jgi:hypothetical protein
METGYHQFKCFAGFYSDKTFGLMKERVKKGALKVQTGKAKSKSGSETPI